MTRKDFNDIIHNTYKKLFAIAFRILASRQEAEDVVQEIFMKMWIMKDKLDEYKDKEALAVTMTRNYSVDILRKRKRLVDASVGNAQPVAGQSPSPYEILSDKEDMSVLKTIIDDLPVETREIVVMREIDGLSYEEISAITTTNINSLRVTISRARHTIREKYIQHFNERRKTERAY